VLFEEVVQEERGNMESAQEVSLMAKRQLMWFLPEVRYKYACAPPCP
jgi:hypothetical protein